MKFLASTLQNLQGIDLTPKTKADSTFRAFKTTEYQVNNHGMKYAISHCIIRSLHDNSRCTCDNGYMKTASLCLNLNIPALPLDVSRVSL